jgi:hypothetical protein
VLTVDTFTYTDEAGDAQTVSASLYIFDETTSRIIRKNAETWPATFDDAGVISITYTAGMDAVPADVKHAILLAIGEYYKGGEASAVSLDGLVPLLCNERIYHL